MYFNLYFHNIEINLMDKLIVILKNTELCCGVIFINWFIFTKLFILQCNHILHVILLYLLVEIIV